MGARRERLEDWTHGREVLRVLRFVGLDRHECQDHEVRVTSTAQHRKVSEQSRVRPAKTM